MDDPEIEAMLSTANALASLDEAARGRVLRWAAERFNVTLGNQGHRRFSDPGDEVDVTPDHAPEDAPAFEHFAELVAKAQPKSEAEKVLVAAYWVQVVQGHGHWGARTLSAELKHVGHPVSNVTRALTTNIKKKPQLVIQLNKSGRSQQSNKDYKATDEGIVYVQGMLRGGGS